MERERIRDREMERERIRDREKEGEFEHFDDFTLASSWERFISDIEAVCRQWLADGRKNLLEKGAVNFGWSKDLYMVKSELKYAMKGYCIECYFECNKEGKVADWICTLHDLQLSFGVKDFLVIAPLSASGVVLDAPEASKLLSAVAIALSNCSRSFVKLFAEIINEIGFGDIEASGKEDMEDEMARNTLVLGLIWKDRSSWSDKEGQEFMACLSEAVYNGRWNKLGLCEISLDPVVWKHLWPAFVPVHDPSRKAYIGIQNMGTVFTRRFEADRIGSQVPRKLMHLEGLYELFVSKFVFSPLDFSMHLFKVHFTMKLTYRTVPYDGDDEVQESDAEINTSSGSPGGNIRNKTQWDDDCPWSEWYSAEDPVNGKLRVATMFPLFGANLCLIRGLDTNFICISAASVLPKDAFFLLSFVLLLEGFELITIWSEKTIESSLEMAELENASLHEAEKWVISPIFSPNLNDDSEGKTICFASQLRLLTNAMRTSLEAQFVEDFVSAVDNSGSDRLRSSAVIPPPTVLDRVLKDLFHEGLASSYFIFLPFRLHFAVNVCLKGGAMEQSLCGTEALQRLDEEVECTYSTEGMQLDFAEGGHKSSRTIKGAPLESLFAQFCLHSLWFGDCNIRAIAVLWIEFVREVRWCWEESQPLPRMQANGVIDLSTCLINQKLHMLAICIDKKRQENQKFQESVETKDNISAHAEDGNLFGRDLLHKNRGGEGFDEESDSPSTSDGRLGSGASKSSLRSKHQDVVMPADLKPSDRVRRGSAGVVGSMMLMNSKQYMHAPFTQETPVMTEDMHEERLRAVEAFGDSFSFSAQLERDILSSDMSAFKAANLDASFEDFIRWHSPKDWENDDIGEGGVTGSDAKGRLRKDWPPPGRLSERMSEYGNSWRKIWNDAPALPSSEQKPLLDPNREGEKVLHYLETLRPHQLLEQMVCTSFRAAADTLSLTTFGSLKQMTTKMQQLYLTMASALKPLQTNQFDVDDEISGDLRRLCAVFEHVEKLLTVAASLHRKFLEAPRLSEAIFSDFYNLYLTRMGTGSVRGDVNKDFDKKQEVRLRERDVIANMFTPPTANQSWRKVLSMGNLLNGHEPILREIIFSLRDRSLESTGELNPVLSRDY
ncbi:hypothetical protein RJ640_025143 [Escallonia rubra]|uniref:Rab3 GTPase-activating protein catalytic subunit n=1 Tax=Escallonia rubra TaxID=112253 RepID=A0AA88UPC7_9ASTE|nr:hypothetical protein RJ640_025143 [Escallonia rubra]